MKAVCTQATTEEIETVSELTAPTCSESGNYLTVALHFEIMNDEWQASILVQVYYTDSTKPSFNKNPDNICLVELIYARWDTWRRMKCETVANQ